MQIGAFYILITLAVLFILFCGIGLSFAKLFGLKDCDAELTLSAFWVGWAFVIISLQLWHLFSPVDSKAFINFVLVGILCLIWNRNIIINLFRTNLIDKLILTIIFCLIIIFIVNQAIGPIIVYDSGLYHIQSMRWISSYPIIPGLGNLHGRLAFNSSYFLYLSLIDVGYWSHKSHHLGNALLFLVILCQIVCSGYKVVRDKFVVGVYDNMRIIFIIPIIILCAVYASSPTPDIPVFLLGTVGSIQLCRLLYSDDDYHDTAFNVFLIVIISVVGITIKPNFLFLGCPLSIVAFGKFLTLTEDTHYLSKKRLCVYLLATFLITLLPWIARNIILSGYFIYPSTFASLDVDWKIPYHNVVNEAQLIKSWARQPAIPPDKVLANWDWLVPWAKRLINNRLSLLIVIAPLLIFIGAVILNFYRSKQSTTIYRQYILFIFPAIISLVLWFYVAPNPKFSGASFWYLGAGALAVAYQRFSFSYFKKLSLLNLLLSVTVALLLVTLYRGKLQNQIHGIISQQGFYMIPSVELKTLITKSGLLVYTPKEGDQCWDAPLPCTPCFNATLRLRIPGKLASGFTVASPQQNAEPDAALDVDSGKLHPRQ